MMSLGLMEAFAFSLPIVCAMVCMVLMLPTAGTEARAGKAVEGALGRLTGDVAGLARWCFIRSPARFLVLPSRLY